MYMQSHVRKIHRSAPWEIGKDQELDSGCVASCSGIPSLLIIFTGHDIILCAVFLSPWIVHRWPWLFCIVRCMSKNSREDVWAGVCTYVGLRVVLNVIRHVYACMWACMWCMWNSGCCLEQICEEGRIWLFEEVEEAGKTEGPSFI